MPYFDPSLFPVSAIRLLKQIFRGGTVGERNPKELAEGATELLGAAHCVQSSKLPFFLPFLSYVVCQVESITSGHGVRVSADNYYWSLHTAGGKLKCAVLGNLPKPMKCTDELKAGIRDQ